MTHPKSSPPPQHPSADAAVAPAQGHGAPVLRVVCSWCKRVMFQGPPGAETTHGICQPCDDKFRAENGLSLKTAWGTDK